MVNLTKTLSPPKTVECDLGLYSQPSCFIYEDNKCT